MDPDQIVRVCDELDGGLGEAPGERLQGWWGMADWHQARQELLAEISKLEDAPGCPTTEASYQPINRATG